VLQGLTNWALTSWGTLHAEPSCVEKQRRAISGEAVEAHLLLVGPMIPEGLQQALQLVCSSAQQRQTGAGSDAAWSCGAGYDLRPPLSSENSPAHAP
jgi:hypothetical protein